METEKKTILIVDDNEINRMILADMLYSDYDLLEASNGQEALEIINDKSKDITLVLLDIVMPVLDGFGVLLDMKTNNKIDDIPVIMISAETAPVTMNKAFDLGAADYISRPFDKSIVMKRIKNTMVLYGKQKHLIDILVEQTVERERENNLMIAILSHIVEFRNGESGRHVQNINMLTELLLKQLLIKSDKYKDIRGDAHIIRLASSLHDIGKIGIADEILNKPGRLTPEEYEIMKTHSMLGAQAMQQLEIYKNEKLVKYSYEICRWHHERWDGKGYPDGLKGDEIPIAAQIVSLADVYDALTSKRCYKSAFSHEKSMEMILGGECGQFNPLLLECLVDAQDKIQEELNSPARETKEFTESMIDFIKRRISYDA